MGHGQDPMKGEWLHRQQRDHLLLFCNGWGMDSHPFLPLTATDLDVLMLFDYQDPEPEQDGVSQSASSFPAAGLADLFNRYPRISLIAWSMGVWAGQQLFAPWAHRLHRAIAINGTLCPIDDGFGIPVTVYAATLARFNGAGRLKFYRRMCQKREILETFLTHQPKRSLASQRLELAALHKQVSCQPPQSSLYSRVVISSQDLVMPTASQLAFWQGHNILSLEGSHFPFYRWESWDEMLRALQ
jgi:pimeloyl-[acyl-carrier protein] methyl ester esterase